MSFMYTLRKISDFTEFGNALALTDGEALHQIRVQRQRDNAADLTFELVDNPHEANYVLEKRPAIPPHWGHGWTRDPSIESESIFVRA